MNDIQCHVRVYVARHGEAEYDDDLLSDAGGSLTTLGRKQAAELADALAGQRIARIYTSSMSRAVQTAEIAAARLGVDVKVRDSLREFSVGDHAGQPGDPDPLAPTFALWLAGDVDARVIGGESGREITDRMRTELDAISDAHRGEAVLVVSHGGAIGAGVPRLARNIGPTYAEGRWLGNCQLVELAADDDGWQVLTWAGERI